MENIENWEYMHTEKYIREKEKKEQDWNNKNKELERRYLFYIDERIKSGNSSDREELLTLFRDGDFINTFKSKNNMAYAIVIMQIYERESQNSERKTILDIGGSLKEIKSKLMRLKFILWRIEFVKDIDAKVELLDFVHTNSTSPDMLQYMVQTAVVDKVEVLLSLTDIFIGQTMFRYAFRMLEYLDELLPEDENVLCMLAEICASVGNKQRMVEYLNRIKNPGILTEGIRKKYGC